MKAIFVDASTAFARAGPRMIPTRGGPVECVVSGEGPAVLAIHGGVGGYDQGQRVAAAALGTDGYTLVAVSRPGYLGTALAVGPTPAEQADLFADMLDVLNIPDVVVVAISAGGPSALHFALRHPRRCRGLILISACAGRLSIRLPLRVRGLRLMARWPNLAATVLRRIARDPERIARWLISDPQARAAIRDDAESRALLIDVQREVLARLAPRMRGTEHDLRLFGVIADYPLERIAVPVLALHGTADEIVSFAHAEAVAARVKGADMVAIEGGEHLCLFTHRELVRAHVRDFLALHAAAPRQTRRQARG